MSTDELVSRARELAADHDRQAPQAIVEAAGGDRATLEAARDRLAIHLHRHADDYGATAALTLLNRVLADLPRTDPLDWRVRWAHHRKP